MMPLVPEPGGDTTDPRDIPVLTEAVDESGREYGFFDDKAVHAAVVSETLKLADSLLHQAIKDIEATLFERIFDEMRAQLPELVDRVLRQYSMGGDANLLDGTATSSTIET